MSGVRPRTATWAAYLVLLTAAAGAAQALTEFAGLRHLANGSKAVAGQLGPEMTAYVTSNFKSNAQYAATIGLVAVAIVLLFVPLLRGRRWARRTTWVVTPILVITQILLMGGDSGSVQTGAIISDGLAGGSHERAMEITRQLIAAWYLPLHFLTEGIVLASVVVAAVLLTRREVGEYFAREAEADDERLWSVSDMKREQPTR